MNRRDECPLCDGTGTMEPVPTPDPPSDDGGWNDATRANRARMAERWSGEPLRWPDGTPWKPGDNPIRNADGTTTYVRQGEPCPHEVQPPTRKGDREPAWMPCALPNGHEGVCQQRESEPARCTRFVDRDKYGGGAHQPCVREADHKGPCRCANDGPIPAWLANGEPAPRVEQRGSELQEEPCPDTSSQPSARRSDSPSSSSRSSSCSQRGSEPVGVSSVQPNRGEWYGSTDGGDGRRQDESDPRGAARLRPDGTAREVPQVRPARGRGEEQPLPGVHGEAQREVAQRGSDPPIANGDRVRILMGDQISREGYVVNTKRPTRIFVAVLKLGGGVAGPYAPEELYVLNRAVPPADVEQRGQKPSPALSRLMVAAINLARADAASFAHHASATADRRHEEAEAEIWAAGIAYGNEALDEDEQRCAEPPTDMSSTTEKKR